MTAEHIVVERRTIEGGHRRILMQLERVPCGRDCRRCPHGPYWYAYWKEDGRTRSAYVGKDPDVAHARAAVAKVSRKTKSPTMKQKSR